MNFPSSVQFYIEPEITINEWDFLNATDLLNRSRTPTIMDQVDRKAGAKLGIPLGNLFKGTIGAHYLSNNDFYSNSTTVVSNDTLDVLRFRGIRYSIALSRNSLNKKQFPNKGAFLRTTLDYFTGREIYTPGSTSEIPAQQTINRAWIKWQLEAERYFFRFSPYRLGYYAHLVLSNQPFFSNYRGSLMNAPGFYPMIDSRNLFLENYRAYSFGALGVKNIFLINKNFEMRLEAYGFLPFQKIVNKNGLPELQAPDKIYPAGTFTTVYQTPVGPASLSLTYYDDQQDQWSVFLNFGYAIFNRKSTE
jgi:NTE family protein